MTATLLVIHIILAVSLVAVILVQRTSSDGGGLMGGGGSSSMGGLMTVRGTANFLTRLTSFLACGFVATSILLTILGGTAHHGASLADDMKPLPVEAPAAADKTAPAQSTPAQSVPAVPLSK